MVCYCVESALGSAEYKQNDPQQTQSLSPSCGNMHMSGDVPFHRMGNSTKFADHICFHVKGPPCNALVQDIALESYNQGGYVHSPRSEAFRCLLNPAFGYIAVPWRVLDNYIPQFD